MDSERETEAIHAQTVSVIHKGSEGYHEKHKPGVLTAFWSLNKIDINEYGRPH